MSRCLQVAAGSVGRDYADHFLRHGMAFVGGDPHCATMAGVQPGDRLILKRGMSQVVAVGEVVARNGAHRGNAAEAEQIGDVSKSWLRDFDGWDLQAWCYVDWRRPPDEKPYATSGLTRSTIQQVLQEHLLSLAEMAIRDWQRALEPVPEPAPTRLVSDEEILNFLIEEGLRPGGAEELTSALARARRLCRYYYDNIPWDQVREHEARTFLVVPLLLALGWAEQQLKIEHPVPGGRADVCAFRKPFHRSLGDAGAGDCALLIETKGFAQGLDYAPIQARAYAHAFPTCRVLLVTNGYCYKVYQRSDADGFPDPEKPTAYLNILSPREAYPLDPTAGGCLEALGLLLPTAHA